MRHLLYCYRSRLDSYLCLKKKLPKHLPTLNLVALCQNQILKNKKKCKKNVFPTDQLQFFWLCNRKQRPFFRPQPLKDFPQSLVSPEDNIWTYFSKNHLCQAFLSLPRLYLINHSTVEGSFYSL